VYGENVAKERLFTVKSELVLTQGMHRNYIALQNFLNSRLPPKRIRRSSRSFSKSEKDRQRKIYLLSLQDFKCKDCGVQFHINEYGFCPEATADHVIPYRYGSTLCHNCEFVCSSCNSKRTDTVMENIIRFFGSIKG